MQFTLQKRMNSTKYIIIFHSLFNTVPYSWLKTLNIWLKSIYIYAQLDVHIESINCMYRRWAPANFFLVR
jgi:hypothetical protein